MGKAAEVAGDLTRLVERGRWSAGDRLPTEAELCERYGASRPTVRKALSSLAAAGLLDSRQGAGWFVQGDQRRRFPLDTVNTSRLTARDDVWHAWVTSIKRVAGHRLTVSVEPPPRDVATLLGLIDMIEPLAVARRRVRTIDGQPAMLSTGWWPMWLASGGPLSVEGEGDAVDMRNPSPLSWATQAGWPSLREQNEIGARLPTEFEVDALGMNPATPLITMHTTSWTHDDRPLRCTADLFPSQRFVLTVGRDTP